MGGQAGGQLLSPLAPKPNWAELDRFQETMTREEFGKLLDQVYAPGAAVKDLIELQPAAAVIKTSVTPPATWTLRFAGKPEEAKPAPRTWRTAAQMGAAPEGKPLAGVKIAIDPGHLGGSWARMEERYFQLGESKPVVEGDMTEKRALAKLIAPWAEDCQALGAEVRLLQGRRMKPGDASSVRRICGEPRARSWFGLGTRTRRRAIAVQMIRSVVTQCRR